MRISPLIAVTLLFSVSAAAAQTASSSSEPVVVVTGDGLVEVTPDLAWVTLAVESRAKEPRAAQEEAARRMAAVQDRLVAAGVPRDAIRTLGYNLQLESDWVDGKQVPRGYVVRNTIEVRLDNIARVGEIIDIAIAAGANAVQGIRFDVKNREALEREALKQAAADALARAEAAAAGVGAGIGRVIRIEQPEAPQPRPMMMREAMAAQDSGVATPIVPGEIEIRATVVLTATIR